MCRIKSQPNVSHNAEPFHKLLKIVIRLLLKDDFYVRVTKLDRIVQPLSVKREGGDHMNIYKDLDARWKHHVRDKDRVFKVFP